MMKITYFEEKHTSLWEDFVQESRNGTFMQLRKFLNYHPPGRFYDRSLMVFDKKQHLLAVIPAAIKKEQAKKMLFSHPGTSHGGIIVGHNIKTDCLMEIVTNLKEFAKQEQYDGVQLKMVPRIYHKWPCDEVDYALRYHGFFVCSTELATALPLQNYHHQRVSNSTKRNVRKAINNKLMVKECNHWERYWEMLYKNLLERHNAKPTHTYAELQELIKRFKKKIKLFGVYHQEKLIGGTVVMMLNPQVINCFYIAHDEEYQHLRPLNLLFDWLIQWGKKQGYQYLDWGISTEHRGSKLNSGLINFKEGFGGRGILRETYKIEL